MASCISIGNYNKNYIYIIFYIIIALSNNSLYGINYYVAFNELKIFPDYKFSQFSFIRQIFSTYLGTFILAFIFSIYERKKYHDSPDKNKSNKDEKESSRNQSSSIMLIHEDGKEKEKKKIAVFPILAIVFGWILEEQLIEKYNCTISHLDFWMLELIVICYLNSKIFKLEIYKHQKFVLLLSLFPILFKIVTIILTFHSDKFQPIYVQYREHSYWIIPLALIIYIPLITLKAYIFIKLKWLMDLKYISANKLLMTYGLIGASFYSIFAILSSFKYFTDNENLSYIFIDKKNSFSEYFTTTDIEWSDILIEIIANVLGMLTSYFIKYNFMMIIKYLTAVHTVFLTPIFYFFFKVVLLIYNVIYCIINNNWDKFFDTSSMEFLYPKFFLDTSGDVFSFFGFLIYLEIIELNCCDLNYNIRNTIISRGKIELINIDDEVFDNLNESDDEDDNNDINKANTTESIETLIRVKSKEIN